MIGRRTRVLSESGSVLFEVDPMEVRLTANRQMLHGQHLKKKCKLWAPTWQKEMGWPPKRASPNGETRTGEALHEQGQLRLPVQPASLPVRIPAVFHVNSDFVRVITGLSQRTSCAIDEVGS